MGMVLFDTFERYGEHFHKKKTRTEKVWVLCITYDFVRY